jgi:hypothetical protein
MDSGRRAMYEAARFDRFCNMVKPRTISGRRNTYPKPGYLEERNANNTRDEIFLGKRLRTCKIIQGSWETLSGLLHHLQTPAMSAERYETLDIGF